MGFFDRAASWWMSRVLGYKIKDKNDLAQTIKQIDMNDPDANHYGFSDPIGPAPGSNVVMEKGLLCCDSCDNPLVYSRTGGYWCATCKFPPSLQDTYIRVWDDH